MAVKNNEVSLDKFLKIAETEYLAAVEEIDRQTSLSPFKSIKDRVYSYFLFGPPGIGKTEGVYTLAQRLAEATGKTLVTFNELEVNKELFADVFQSSDKYFVFVEIDLSKVEPSDLNMPDVARNIKINDLTLDNVLENKYPKWALALSKHPGILFLDELSNVQRDDVISAAFKIIGQNMVGNIELHPKVAVISAGNGSESIVTRELPIPLLDRGTVFRVTPPTPGQWYQHMSARYGDRISKDIIAFLASFSDDTVDYSAIDNVENGEKIITSPRSLELLLRKCVNYKIDKMTMTKQNEEKWDLFFSSAAGTIAPVHFSQFMVYMEQRSKMATLLEEDKLNRATQIAASVYLGDVIRNITNATDEDFKDKIHGYLVKVTDIPRYINKLTKQKEFIGFLILGTGAFDKETSLKNMFKTIAMTVAFADEQNVKDLDTLKKLKAKIDKDFDFKIIEILIDIDSPRSKFDALVTKLESYATNGVGKAILDKMMMMGHDTIVKTVQNLADYYKYVTKEIKEKEKINSALKNLKGKVSDEDLKETIAYLNQKISKFILEGIDEQEPAGDSIENGTQNSVNTGKRKRQTN